MATIQCVELGPWSIEGAWGEEVGFGLFDKLGFGLLG